MHYKFVTAEKLWEAYNKEVLIHLYGIFEDTP